MKHKLALPLIAFSFAIGGCATSSMPAATAPVSDAAKPKAVTLSYQQGEVLSYVLITGKDTDAAKAARKTYYDTAFPLADQYGLRRDLNLAVPQQLVGKYKADAMAIFSYPDAASLERLNATTEWPAIKALRPKAWDELAIFTQTLEQPLEITFDPDKIYTLAVAEIKPGVPDDYNKYMKGIEPGLNEMGGRFVYRMINPSIEAHRHTYDPQVQVTMVEWDTPEALAGFTKSPGYKANSKYFTSGVSGFSFFQIAPRTPTSS
jgi:uncharacterized protein (DUF1330 family)